MDEEICSVQISKGHTAFVAKIQSELGGLREYRSKTFEDLLEQVLRDLQEEFEG